MTTSPPGGDIRPPFHWQFAGALAAIVLLTHLAVNVWTPYGVHRDEFLYLAMGEHLRLFRMDFPPAIALIALAERGVLGDSLLAIRFVPALGDAALIVLAAAMARELGGGRFAQALAAIAVALHPLFLRPGNLFQPVFLDQLCWTSALFALARFERTRDPRWWYVIGAIGGLGLLTKFSILFIGFALLIALLLDDRPALRTRGPWLALAIALAIGSPSVIGQIRLGYPVVAQMTTLRASQLAHVSVGSFLSWQMLFGPSCVLAAAGVLWLLLATAARPVRILGISCAAVFVTLLLLRGKPYYVGPVYPTLLAAGMVWLERIGRSFGAQVARAGAVAAIVLYDAFLLPLALPALPPPMMARYAAASGITEAVRTNRGTVLRLPQDFADMLGWEERVALVAHVFDSLPPAKRAQAVLVGENYGEAGALEFYGPRYHLPAPVSAAGSFWFFGPGEKPGDVLITLGVSREDLARLYDVVTPAAHLRNDWTVEEEQDLTVYVCERPRRTLQSIWPELAGRN